MITETKKLNINNISVSRNNFQILDTNTNSNMNKNNALNTETYTISKIDTYSNSNNDKMKKNRNSTPFQDFENKNYKKKSFLKEKINKINSPNNLKIESNSYNTKEFFASKNIGKFNKNLNFDIYNSSIEKLSTNDKFFMTKINNDIPIRLKRLENNVLIIDTCNSNSKNNNNYQGKYFYLKTPLSKNFNVTKNSSNKKLLTEPKFKNQSAENTEMYFYSKNLNFNNNNELKNLIKYKKRSNVNNEKNISDFATKTKRFLKMKEKILDKNYLINNFKNRLISAKFEFNNFNFIKPKIISRQHSSTIRNIIHNELSIKKLDKISFNKIK
jgi:hypothetical protein